MKPRSLTAAGASALVSELRTMALLPAGLDRPALARATEICFLLRGLDPARGQVGQSAARAMGLIEVLLSNRRWKTETTSLEALRKDIKSACDRLRVAVEGALHATKSV